MKDKRLSPANQMRLDRMKYAQDMVRASNGKTKLEIEAILSLNLGVKEQTAQEYLKVMYNAGLITIDKDRRVVWNEGVQK